MLQFKAGAFAVQEDEDLNTFLVAFAEHPDGDSQRFEIQRSIEIDEQDIEHGMDTYCLCTSWGATHYGDVASWALKDGQLEIELMPAAQKDLEVDGIVIELDLADEDREFLRNGLAHVFLPVSERTLASC